MNRVFSITALVLVISCFTTLPAYSEVTSLSTNAAFYKGGSTITFSGTILPSDPYGITIVINGPQNNFITLVSGLADSSHNFKVSFDTSTVSNSNLLKLKGMYNATAFVTNKTQGKTVTFAYSPDGTALTTSPPNSLTATPVSPTEIDLAWLAPTTDNGIAVKSYKLERNDGNGFNLIASTSSLSYKDTNLQPNTEHAYRVSAVNAAGQSLPSNTADVFTKQVPVTTTTPTTTSTTPNNGSQSFEEMLKQRIETAKRLNAMLNAQQNQSTAQTTPVPQTSNLSQTTVPKPSATNQTATSNATSPAAITPSSSQANQTVTTQTNVSNAGQSKTQSINATAKSLENLKINLVPNLNLILYPLIAVAGAVIVAVIIYNRKKRESKMQVTQPKPKTTPFVEKPVAEPEDDYAMTILRNRLAKGEITVEEFQKLKDELSEL